MNLQAHVDLSTVPLGAAIDPKVYGHFLESAFFGNIEGGVYDEGSPRSYPDGPLQGCRVDVLEACAELGVPVLRWPGGNFTSAYWWQDGVGPKEARPRRLELAWGSEESNRFGTPEFLAWCEAVKAEPYLAHSRRSVDDAVRWVEYTNYAGRTDLADQRRRDGRDAPWAVRLWGLGNEVYGDWQMGHRDVGRYVADAREHARFMRAVDPNLQFVAVGHPREDWTEAVVAGLGESVEYLSLHLYGASEHLVRPTAAEFEAVVGQAVHFERTIVEYSRQIEAIADRCGIELPPSIAMDEWNIRHLEPESWPDPQPGPDGGTAERQIRTESQAPPRRVNRHSPRTLADALFYAGVFHAVHRAARLPVPVAMTNTVNLVNANGLINVRPDGIVRTASYWVWDLYHNHFGTRLTANTVIAPARYMSARLSDEDRGPGGDLLTAMTGVSYLDVSSSLDDAGRLTVALINRSPAERVDIRLSLDGRHELPAVGELRELGTATGDLFAVNTIGDDDRVVLSQPRDVRMDDGVLTVPPHSVTLLTLGIR